MILVAWHLGLGDAIACAAIVSKLAQENDTVVVPCWDRNEESVKSFFIDHPNVIVKAESNKEKIEGNCEVLKLGYYNPELPQLPDEDFVQWFYRQAGMDITDKEKYCPVKKAAEKSDQFTIKVSEFSFCHDDSLRGFNIKRDLVKLKPSYKPKADGSILKHSELLLTAKEVHCIDSSFIHLAEALGVKWIRFYSESDLIDEITKEVEYLRKYETMWCDSQRLENLKQATEKTKRSKRFWIF
jgi:hypothetical protein